MKKALILCSTLAAGLVLASCSASTTSSEDKELSVLATFYPMYEFTQQIVGDEGTVSLLIPAGTDAHDYEPSAKDAAKIQDADVFVYNDEHLETWVTDLSDSLTKGTIIKAAENILLLPGSDDGHDHSDEAEHTHELDPHVWLAPNLAIKQVETIRDGLIEAYPEKESDFTKNAAAYIAQLQELDSAYRESFEQAQQKHFVTQHAAFGYLALEYGLTQVPISGISPDQEPSPARIAELKEYVDKNDIRYIYSEENAADKIAKTLADEANVQMEVLNTLESITTEQQENGETYITLMMQNLAALEKTTTISGKDVIEPESDSDEKTVYQGYFEDDAVKDRSLSDWTGEWQSVYPYLQDGSLDQVFDYKAKLTKKMTADDYKAYYTIGYTTSVDTIIIEEDTMNFIYEGQDHKAAYKYAGKKILTYAAGNRGVRYLFEAVEDVDGAFRYIQFSDHNISPVQSDHFHIYFGNDSQELLLSEMDNWPTYYPTSLSAKEIAQEMIAH